MGHVEFQYFVSRPVDSRADVRVMFSKTASERKLGATGAGGVMGTESRSPAAKSARARAVKRATAAVDADATAAPLTSVGSSARDSDACVEERVIVEPRGLATSVAGFPVTNDTPEHADAPDKSCASVELNDS